MYYVATPEFMEQWDRAKEGELVCRMEKAIGGLPRFTSIEEMLRQMDDAGVEKATGKRKSAYGYIPNRKSVALEGDPRDVAIREALYSATFQR